jgi:hypothetical protein
MEKLKTMEEKLIKGGYARTVSIWWCFALSISLSLSLYCLATDDTDDVDTDAMCRRGSDIQGQQAGSGIAPR